MYMYKEIYTYDIHILLAEIQNSFQMASTQQTYTLDQGVGLSNMFLYRCVQALTEYTVALDRMGLGNELDAALIKRSADVTALSLATAFESYLCRSLRKPEGERAKKVAKYVRAYGNVDSRLVCRQLWDGAKMYCPSMAAYPPPADVLPAGE